MCLQLTHGAKHCLYCSICAAVCALACRILEDLGILPWLTCGTQPGTCSLLPSLHVAVSFLHGRSPDFSFLGSFLYSLSCPEFPITAGVLSHKCESYHIARMEGEKPLSKNLGEFSLFGSIGGDVAAEFIPLVQVRAVCQSAGWWPCTILGRLGAAGPASGQRPQGDLVCIHQDTPKQHTPGIHFH